MKGTEVLERLMTGEWELGCSGGMDGRAWIQSPGLMRGGQTVDLTWPTLHALRRKGLVKVDKREADPFWLTRYVLADGIGMGSPATPRPL